MLVTYEEVLECDEEGFKNLKKMCRVVFMRHYSIYEQYYEEMSSNAITAVYEALPQYNPNYSWINYLYTVIRNSYTKDVNKYRRVFVREQADFRNEVSKLKENCTIKMEYRKILKYKYRFQLNEKHFRFLIEVLNNNGIYVRGAKNNPTIFNVNEWDEDYIGRIVGIILYDYFEEVGGVVYD